ncbi:YeeE/YedE family protein [Roseovarius mucosus]|uniref:YeeE/YedE family protein n=1 Tax=Roseovarius TaxID=74030 RepID=UPI001C5DDBB7|nr:YeeE/YedE thiosulfate transporter family protein [Roseovarius mucosus]MBW4973059.1 YeeE/YedE family protein [Roseovarius mucosus]|tara:strand:+ start:7789 stop:8229 length:441 start_codon:yes stop_codon:yes gene_type:complete
MTGTETEFTPLMSFAGGVLIGLSAVLLMFFQGRIMGATGILSGLIAGGVPGDKIWRAAMVVGMIAGPLLVLGLTGQMPAVEVPISLPMILIGGFIVGIGVTFGSGCTSGHGVCGLARLSPRSFVATLTFMVVAFATVYVLRHVIGA